jgi:hypothetical protein
LLSLTDSSLAYFASATAGTPQSALPAPLAAFSAYGTPATGGAIAEAESRAGVAGRVTEADAVVSAEGVVRGAVRGCTQAEICSVQIFRRVWDLSVRGFVQIFARRRTGRKGTADDQRAVQIFVCTDAV